MGGLASSCVALPSSKSIQVITYAKLLSSIRPLRAISLDLKKGKTILVGLLTP